MEPKKDLNLYQRIQGIMSDVHMILKGDKKVNGQYSFISHDSVTKELHPALVKWGVIALPTVESCSQDENRTVMSVKVTFINTDKPDERESILTTGYGIDGQDKGPGKAMSYVVKMAYLKAFCLESGEADIEEDVTTPYKSKAAAEKSAEIAKSFRKKGDL